MQAVLADIDGPAARLHLAVLRLADHFTPDEVHEIVTDGDTATEHAFQAVDRADIGLLRLVLDARPTPLTGVTGAFFASVLAAADGDADRARQLAEAIAEDGTDIQRRAYAIRLRALAHLTPDPDGTAELTGLVHPDGGR